MARLTTLFGLVFVLASIPASARAAATRVAVLSDFEGRVTEVSREVLSERLIEGLGSAGFDVVGGERVKSVLRDGAGLDACHEPACYRQIASKLSVDFLIIAHVRIKERNYSLRLQLVGGQDGRPRGEALDQCELCGIQEVRGKLDKLALSLISQAGAARNEPARLMVQSQPSGASVTIDGRAAGDTPLSLDLPPGAHEVAIAVSGRVGARKKITLEPGIRGLISVDLMPLPGAGREGGTARVVGLVSLGVGAAAVAGGIAVLTLLDHKRVLCDGQKSFNMYAVPSGQYACYDNSAELPAGVLFGVGGAAILGGGLLLFVDWGPGTSTPADGSHARVWMLSASGTF